MSDPVTNVEIEDVLSSIRRLVSEDTRPKAPSEASGKPERLVLMPSQRVPEAETPVAARPATDAVLLTQPTLVPEPVADVPEETPSDAGAAPVAQTGPDEEDADIGTPAAPEAGEVTAPTLAGEIEAGSDGDAMADAGGTVSESDSEEGGLARKIAELEEMISRSAESFEPDEPEEGANAAFVHHPREPLAWEDHFADAFVPAEPEPEPAEAPEATVLRGPAWKGEHPAHSPREHETAAEQTLQTPPVHEAPAQHAPQPPSLRETAARDLPAEIDEEMLREMVTAIVRQELQGALGERITRNVRKLVRREINRMLASQDFT